MRYPKHTTVRIALALAALALWTAGSSVRADEPAGAEVQARGPVHEAYAEPSDPQPQPSIVVTKEPPTPIEETPAEQKPEGDDVQWIPGYWAWDDESNDFLWVSGFWREPPPGRRWVPGSWQTVDRGWQWVSGFWASDAATEVQYVPEPPPTLERGPSTPAPNDNSTYVPGCWVFVDARFLWRPGYWVKYYPDWVYTPARYIWTPGGCVFLEGYWDHPLYERGLLFAPVRFDRRVLVRGFTYTPSYIVEPDALLGSLFVNAPTRRFYFGDYFGPTYVKGGFTPWIDYHPAGRIFFSTI
jgi:hypothetical protein